MEGFFIFFNILLVIIGIAMMVLFIQNCVNIAKIKNMIELALDTKSKNNLAQKDILKAILQGRQKEIYSQIIGNLTSFLYNKVVENGYSKISFKTEELNEIDTQIKTATRFCSYIDMSLPKELESMANFIEFMNAHSQTKYSLARNTEPSPAS